VSPSSGGGLIARAYRLTTRPVDPSADEPVEVRPGLAVPKFVLEWSRSGLTEAAAVLASFPPVVQLPGRSVATIGRGAGDLALEAARSGARDPVAIDMAMRRLELSKIRKEEEFPGLDVEFRAYREGLDELAGRRFEVVLAADAFRRYGADRASRHVEARAREISRLVEPGGLLAVAFGPSWRAPHGGGIDSRLPWAHLVFPERVIFEEFRRVRPASDAATFDDIGINRITTRRLRLAIEATRLSRVYFATNVGTSKAIRATRGLSMLPVVGECFTQNAYGVWRRA
jgi:ubiquinone/menaquinone biosynthesis C-methylase UbiE